MNLFAAIAVILGAFSGMAISQAGCESGNEQTAWIEKALTTWKNVRKNSLRLPPQETPWLILFDESCVIHLNPDARFIKIEPGSGSTPKKIKLAGESLEVFVSSHNGKIRLPENGEVPAQLLSFAAPYDQGKRSFLISALPSLWRNAPHLKDEKNVVQLAASVFVHEMTHTLHRNFYSRLDEIEKTLSKTESIDDDMIQNKFGKIGDFAAMVAEEKELLFQAFAAPNRTAKKLLAAKAYNSITARRRHYFTGENAIFADLEDIFLTMEGVANWAAYKAALYQVLSKPDALKLIRRSGKYWSQEEGIALFLAIDALLSGWQKKAFATRNASAIEMLAEAVK